LEQKGVKSRGNRWKKRSTRQKASRTHLCNSKGIGQKQKNKKKPKTHGKTGQEENEKNFSRKTFT